MIKCRGIWLPDHETHLQPHIERGPLVDGKGTYQFQKIELALSHVKQWRTAVDVGAHVGLWARVLAGRFERVEAFEPKSEHHECWERNVMAANVALHRCALGARPGPARMVTINGNSGHSHVTDDGAVEIQMQTLDSFRLDDVDFVKIDTEGYEREVVLGATETLRRCKPVMIVEQKPNNGRRYGHGDYGALKLLEMMGATIVAKKAGDYVLTWATE